MASKRPRKLKSSRRTGSRAARSSQAPSSAKRTTAAKKQSTTTRKAAASKPITPTAPDKGAAKRSVQAKPLTTTRPAPAKAPPRAELLAQARAAGIPGRHRMTAPQLRTALARLADRPAAAATSSEVGRRLSVTATPPPPVAGLPWRYHVTELVAMPVDPVLVHVYWELLPQAVAQVRAELGSGWDGASQVLRAYDVAGVPFHNGDGVPPTARARHHFDLDVGGDVGSYYVHLWSPEQTMMFEIGWRSREGRFVAAARSNRVSTPRNAPCGGAERWMTVRGQRIVATPPDALPRESATLDDVTERAAAAPWSATFPAHRGWGGRQ